MLTKISCSLLMLSVSSKINCLFCFCPLYNMKECGGDFTYTEIKGNMVKDCSGCIFPHNPENYEKIIEKISESKKWFSEKNKLNRQMFNQTYQEKREGSNKIRNEKGNITTDTTEQ